MCDRCAMNIARVNEPAGHPKRVRMGVARGRPPERLNGDRLMETVVPDLFFVFVSKHPMTLNLSTTGQIASTRPIVSPTDWLAVLDGVEQPRDSISPHMCTVLQSPTEMAIEAMAERYRQQWNPQAPSRATCIFAFGDQVSVQAAAAGHQWDLSEVREFSLSILNASHRADMNFVSLARGAAGKDLHPIDPEDYWRLYWAGDECPVSTLFDCSDPVCVEPPVEYKSPEHGPIWEWLIDGALQQEVKRT